MKEQKCQSCGCTTDTPALRFLHEKVHQEPWGQPFGLNTLPFVLMPRVAALMEEYAATCKEAAGEVESA